jgi:hypothetical protein
LAQLGEQPNRQSGAEGFSSQVEQHGRYALLGLDVLALKPVVRASRQTRSEHRRTILRVRLRCIFIILSFVTVVSEAGGTEELRRRKLDWERRQPYNRPGRKSRN